MFVSILSASIATYEGYNPPGYAVFYQGDTLIKHDMTSVYDTWWAKVNQYLGAYLCVNNSYSGSTISGAGFPAMNSMERIGALHTEEYIPDIILLSGGGNDFGRGIPIKDKWSQQKDPDSFYGCYRRTIRRLKETYPQATVICGTMMQTEIRDRPQWRFPTKFMGVEFELYNQAIRKAAKKEKCLLADLGALGWKYETLDGTHPTKRGHETLAMAWIHCIQSLNG